MKLETRLSSLWVLTLLLVWPGAADGYAQTLTGRVTNATTLEPLGGALVVVEGTSTRAVTNPDGRYSISAAPNATLVVTMLGFGQWREAVSNRAVVNVALEPSALQLEGIVAVGYGTQTRATVSGSVSSVTAEQLEGQGFTSVTAALAGVVQGVNVRLMNRTDGNSGQTTTSGTNNQILGESYDGRPGAPGVMQIRNMGDPLVVIDGVPSTSADFNNLNAADIASLSILKDASAAVYGFRAANGVLLVTTKRGSALQAPQVRIDGYYGAQNFTRYHYNPLANAYQYLFSRVDSEQNRNAARSVPKEELEKWRTGAPGYHSIDHYPLAINNPNAAQYQMNGSVSGGVENGQYYISLGHLQQDYNIDEMTWGRSNLTANFSSNLSSRLKIGTELRARNEVRDEISLLGNPSNVHTTLLFLQSAWPFDRPYIGPNEEYINFNIRTPLRSVATLSKDISGEVQDTRRQASANFWTEYQFPFGTTVRGTAAVRVDTRNVELARKSFDMYCHDAKTDTYNVCYNSGDRTRQKLDQRQDGVFGNVTVTHATAIGAHSATAVGFLEMDGSETEMAYVIGQSPNNYTRIMEQARITEFGNTWDINRRSSVGGRFDYDYGQKYLLSLIGRYDGSYLYAPERRWGFFPGISLGWRITEEPWVKNRLGFLDDLKLRASWGQTGREQLPNNNAPWSYLAGATYNVGNGSVLDGGLVYGVRPRGLPLTNLSWVTSVSKNLGIDLLMLDGRLSLEADVFDRALTGLPAPRSDVLLPQELGYTLPNENLNSDATQGFEFLLSWQEQLGRVQYMLSPNMTIARTKPTFRYMDRFGSSLDEWRTGSVGRWAEVNFGYEVIGHFQSMEEIENHPIQIDGSGNRLLLPGDLIYKDQNDDGLINALDERPIGFAINQTPILSFGMGSQFTFAGFTLVANFAGGALFDHARGAETKTLSQGGHNLPLYAMDRWHRADPYNPQSEWVPGRYPPLRISVNNPSFNRNDTFWRTNVRYLRLRRAELGYEVPGNMSGRVGLSNVRIYTNIQNAFSWDNTQHYNLDPEMTRDAGLAYPSIRLASLGFSASVGGESREQPPVPVSPTDDD